MSGSASLVVGRNSCAFRTNDVLLTSANAYHRFVDCSDAFTIWGVFYGPNGRRDVRCVTCRGFRR